MNLGELKNKILSDSAFQSEYENALDSGKLVDWAKSKGVDVSEEELVNAIVACLGRHSGERAISVFAH